MKGEQWKPEEVLDKKILEILRSTHANDVYIISRLQRRLETAESILHLALRRFSVIPTFPEDREVMDMIRNFIKRETIPNLR